jgi:hypothetical protein
MSHCRLPQQLDWGRCHHLKWSSCLQLGRCLNQGSNWIRSSHLLRGRIQQNHQWGQISSLCWQIIVSLNFWCSSGWFTSYSWLVG